MISNKVYLTILIVFIYRNVIHVQSDTQTANSKESSQLNKATQFDNETCKQMEMEVDAILKKILMIGEDLIVPRNQSQLVQHCK